MVTASSTASLDVSKYTLPIKDNAIIRSNIVVVGLGATGSAFMLLLSHFLKYHVRYNVIIYDYDFISHENMSVSMYGFFGNIGLNYSRDSKASSCARLLDRLSNQDNDVEHRGRNNHNKIDYIHDSVNYKTLKANHNKIDYIFVFTDNNSSRHEVSKYHSKHPDTIVFDCRVGSYSEFEVYYSSNPDKYSKTIYYDDKKRTKPSKIITNDICLDDRMNFSIAMSSCSLLMNLFLKYLKGDMKQDFKHIMIGNDYIGEISGYE